MKILTLCQGGACRSVALARVLKDNGGHDALAAAWRYNSASTLQMLYEWADLIIVMQAEYARYVGVAGEKLKICDVGPDRWRSAVHPELEAMCIKWAMDEGLLVKKLTVAV